MEERKAIVGYSELSVLTHRWVIQVGTKSTCEYVKTVGAKLLELDLRWLGYLVENKEKLFVTLFFANVRFDLFAACAHRITSIKNLQNKS